MDFVAIEPFTVPFLSIGMGQRYDFLVIADQPVQTYWLRAIPQTTCSDNDNTDNIKAIVRCVGSSTVDPTTEAYEMPDDCDDEPMASLVPALPLNVGTTFTDKTASASLSLSQKVISDGKSHLGRCRLSGTILLCYRSTAMQHIGIFLRMSLSSYRQTHGRSLSSRILTVSPIRFISMVTISTFLLRAPGSILPQVQSLPITLLGVM
jgi:hypothetical protein